MLCLLLFWGGVGVNVELARLLDRARAPRVLLDSRKVQLILYSAYGSGKGI